MHNKRSFYNIAVGIGSQMLSIALGIVIPRLFLTSFGSEMNGFINLITQIMAYFALLESGVGAASLQALYGPVGKADKENISEILTATGSYYKKTGFFYFLSVFCLAIIYPLAIHSTIPPFTMAIIIIMNGLPGAISYFFQGKYIILLKAEGKNYVITAILSIVSTTINITRILLLMLGFHIIVIQAVYLIFNLVKILYYWLYLNKHYKWINPKAKPNFNAINQKNSAFIAQFCELIFKNAATLILSIFCNLKVVSVYAMYTLIFSIIITALDYISQGFSFIMGQTFNNDRKRFVVLHDLYESYRTALIFALYNIAYIFILPFMKLYTEGITDINYLDPKIPFLFVIFHLLAGARTCSADLINYAQHFKLTQTRCIIEAVINIVTSVILVNVLGIYGVLIGTILALVYRSNDMIIYANKRILNRSPWITYKRVISNTVIFVVVTYITSLFKWNLDSYFNIVKYAAISGIIILVVYFIVASAVNPNSFIFLKNYIISFLKSKKIIKE